MEKSSTVKWFLLFFSFASSIAKIMADTADPNAVYWQKRAEVYRERSLKAYHPDPMSVVHHVNKITKEALDNHHAETAPLNITGRRQLIKKWRGPCMATNPIDRCWRCDPNWARDRKRYADCAQGFGAKAIGGKNGPYYVVTDPSDNDMIDPKPGTLRHAVIQNGPLWIIFQKKMTIKLQQELIMTSDKTIDGRGSLVTITEGAGITIQNVHNIIISDIKIHDIKVTSGGKIRDSIDHFGIRGETDGDAISIYGSHDIWLDHLSMFAAADGLIDAVYGSTGITISNCHFVRHDKVLLFGGRDQDEIDRVMQVTLAYNHFGKNLVQRMPRCRRGFFHVVNNDYTHWLMYAIGGTLNATIISQGNQYRAPDLPDKKEVTHRENNAPHAEWHQWTWVTHLDRFLNGAFFTPSGDPNGAATYAALEKIRPAPGTEVNLLVQFCGHLNCVVGKPC